MNPDDAYGERRRSIRLDDARWNALETIATRHGLLYGGLPSRTAALRYLIDRECERLDLDLDARPPAG